MLRTLSITALPAAVAGAALFLLLTWLAGGSGSSEVASPEARAHVEAPAAVACGQSFTLDVYADDIPAREGQPPGLATFDVWVSHPVNAFSTERGKLTVNDALSTLPTVDGRQRQWLYAGDWFDPPTGTFTWGAFSYIGEPPLDGRIESIEVTADARDAGVGGLRVSADEEPVFLGSATLLPLQEGKHRIEVKLWFTDPSITYYPEVVMERDVTVSGGDCPNVTPVPTATVTITPMPVYTPDPNVTRDPYPGDVTPSARLLEPLDACGSARWYYSELLAARICLPMHWELESPEPRAAELLPEDERPDGYAVGLVFRKLVDDNVVARLAITIIGDPPYDHHRCEFPARIASIDSVCIYDRTDGFGYVAPWATRMIGLQDAGMYATIEVLTGPEDELDLAQREAIAMFASLTEIEAE